MTARNRISYISFKIPLKPEATFIFNFEQTADQGNYLGISISEDWSNFSKVIGSCFSQFYVDTYPVKTVCWGNSLR